MSIDLHYIPLFTLEEVFLDKDTGLPLAGGVVTFYRDLQRQTNKSVFMISGNPPDYTFTDIGNELILGLNGTFVDEDGDPFVPYALPYDANGVIDLYYVTVESSGSVAQFTREAVPYVNNDDQSSEISNNENELSNPQFVEVNIPSVGQVVIDVTGSNTVTSIAPDWDIITSGSGTLTIERLQPTAVDIPTNPPYTLSILASSGLGSAVKLRQRLNNSPTLFRGGFVSGTFIAAVLSGGTATVSMTYAPDSGSSTTIVSPTVIPTDGAYHIAFGNAAIPQQVNTEADNGYIDINISIPTSITVAVSSFQIVGTSTAVDVGFDEQSTARQIDHLFHYYEDASVHQAKGNLLTGWTFGINPWQFYSVTHGNVATNEYTADQTIMIQQNYVQGAVGNNVNVVQGSFAQKYGYLVTAVTAKNKFALLQYIDPSTIRPYWGETLSIMFRASAIIGAGHTTEPRFKVKLIYRPNLPLQISQTNPISSWNDTDDDLPGLTGWTYLVAVNDPVYTLTADVQDFKFDGFVLPDSASDDMTLGVIFIMMNDLDETGTADKILFEKVSLVNSDFAVHASPETFDEGLKRCQFYFRKSYTQGVTPATSGTFIGAEYSFTTFAYVAGTLFFTERFNDVRSIDYTVVIYSPQTGTGGKLFDATAVADLNAVGISKSTSSFTVRVDANVVGANSLLNWHYIVNAKLGI